MAGKGDTTEQDTTPPTGPTDLGAKVKKAWSTLTSLVSDNAGLGVVLVIGVFGTLGIKDDLLFRLFRSAPTPTMIAIGCAVIGLFIGSVSIFADKSGWTLVSAVLLFGSVGIAVVTGIWSIGDREQPAISITNSTVKDAKVTLNITATAHALAVKDHLLLRIAYFPTGDFADISAVCAYTDDGGSKLADIDDHKVPTHAQVLQWLEQGPDGKGEVTLPTSVVLNAPGSGPGPFLCAHAVLSSSHTGDDGRWSTQVVDLSTLGSKSEPTD